MTRAAHNATYLGGALLAGALFLVLSAPAAGAKGIGSAGLPSVNGVVSVDGETRYVALWGRDETTIAAIETGSGKVVANDQLRGSYVVPAVAQDGSPTGISADGETLVLAAPPERFPVEETTFAVLDARRLQVEDTLILNGSFSLDALSPDGSTLYFVEYLSRRDPTQYLVRAYDLESDRLLPDPVVDPNEAAEEMYGYPLTRATSPDGRWAYTLYDSAEHPFIHALDTENATARCIDLPATLAERELFRADLAVGEAGGLLTVEGKSGPLALVDTQTFEVSEPAAPAASSDGGGSWALIAVAVAAALALAAIAAAVLRARGRLRPVG